MRCCTEAWTARRRSRGEDDEEDHERADVEEENDEVRDNGRCASDECPEGADDGAPDSGAVDEQGHEGEEIQEEANEEENAGVRYNGRTSGDERPGGFLSTGGRIREKMTMEIATRGRRRRRRQPTDDGRMAYDGRGAPISKDGGQGGKRGRGELSPGRVFGRRSGEFGHGEGPAVRVRV